MLYVGADVHSDSTTYAALDGSGKLVAKGTVATEPKALVGLVRGFDGPISLTFEEGELSTWLCDLLRPHVASLMVCNPYRNALLKQGNKSDKVDAKRLAELLRLGSLAPVYKGSKSLRALEEFVRARDKHVQSRTRIKNQLKGLFRGHGLVAKGDAIYDNAQRERWLGMLPRKSLRIHADGLYDQLVLLDELVDEVEREMKREARRHEAYRYLMTVPGIGSIRAAQMLALLKSPQRFPDREHLWGYAGLAIITKSSADYVVRNGDLVAARRSQTRGLNRNGNRALKSVLKQAAQDTAWRGAFRDEYHARVASGQRFDKVLLTFARRIAVLCWTLWKNKETYDTTKYRPIHQL